MERVNGVFSELSKKRLNLFIWILYMFLLMFVSYHHEPWHDEGQSWLIARDDSLWQLLTVTTHYEGHPPLWHLCLMPFAKLGVPFLFGLKAVNVLFATLAMSVLIFKSPFPWYVRFTLPFTYFFFYQYGVLNRVYSLLMLAMILTAYYFPNRRKYPFKLALSLTLAAGSQAYGMMFACGVAIVWLREVIKPKNINFKNMFIIFRSSHEIRGLGLLFLCSLFFGICMLPCKDTAFISNGVKTGFWENIFFLFTVMPGQLLASNSMQNNVSDNSILFFLANFKIYQDLFLNQGISGVLIAIHWFISYTYGAFLNIGLFYVCKKTKKLSLFLCPLLLMNLLAALVYWSIYHAGIWVCFYVFILWQLWSDKNNLNLIEACIKQKLTYKSEFLFVKTGLLLCCFGFIVTNFYWTWEASKNNVLYDTDPSEKIVEFIKSNSLTNYNIWVSANYSKNEKLSLDNVVTGPLAVNCYFPKNIFQNLDGGRINHAYHEYKILPIQIYVDSVREFGQPDFILGEEKHLDYVFSKPAKYVPIKKFAARFVWKELAKEGLLYMYAREDMLEKLPWLHRIPDTPDMGM